MTVAGRGRIRAVTDHRVDALTDGWELCATEPGSVAHPRMPEFVNQSWSPAIVPSTVADSLRHTGQWSLDDPPRRFDANDWWYRTRFDVAPAAAGEQLWLCFDGLATITEAWLNGVPLLATAGMFTAHERRIDELVRSHNELVLCFRSLDAALAARRPRPRWRTPMVEHQQLRWYRTTLLGRTPGWSPPAAPVGPWRAVRLERRRALHVSHVHLNAHGGGAVDVSCRVELFDGSAPEEVELLVEREGQTFRAPLAPGRAPDTVSGRLQVPDALRWWPHTHGASPLYLAAIRVRHAGGITHADLGRIGFRTIGLSSRGDDFAIHVNGVPTFCRGACWTPTDPVSLQSDAAALERAFGQVRAAGMNMLRLSGTMVYEGDRFLDLCDEQGVLLWHDLMFANMDYPEADETFAGEALDEVQQHLLRLQGRPSVAVLCGNSEGAQQAAMWGAPRDRWTPAFFNARIAELAAGLCGSVPYVPSSAHGGAFPHQANVGPSSYYGVGAYLRPLDDARRAEVRFASECLAFANLPTPERDPAGLAPLRPRLWWKPRAPRDLGAAWDFDDVRDHYLERLFRIDPVQLRYGDYERYLSLGQVTTGEVMAAAFAEWRRERSVTRGALVWFLRDLWDGAGWGVIDASGNPKPAWFYLRRALAPIALSFSDEGTNGVGLHLTNDGPGALDAELVITLYNASHARVARAERAITVPAHSATELNPVALFDGFYDLSYAYRFGPASHDLIAGVLRERGGTALARAFYFVHGLPSERTGDPGLTGVLRPTESGDHVLTVRAERFAQSVEVAAPGFSPDDNYFHLAPGDEHAVRLSRADASAGEPRVVLLPLNSHASTTIEIGG